MQSTPLQCTTASKYSLPLVWLVAGLSLSLAWNVSDMPKSLGFWLGSSWNWVNLPWLSTLLGMLPMLAYHLRSTSISHLLSSYKSLPDPAGIITAKDGRFVDVNPAFCKMLGLAAQDIIGSTEKELNIFLSIQERAELNARFVREEHIKQLKILYRTAQKPIQGTISSTPVIAKQEKCALFVLHDLTEHESALQSLSALNRFLQQAGYLARLGAWEDRRGEGLVYWSDVCYEMHGLSPQDPLPQDYIDTYVAPEHRAFMRDKFRQSLQTQQDWEIEIQIIRTDGRRLWVRSRGEVVLDANGEVAAMRGVMQDIDDYKFQQTSMLEREALLSVTLQAATLGRWDWDLQNGSITGDAYWCRLNNLEQFSGPSSLGQGRDIWHWTEVMNSHDVPRCHQELVRHINTPDDGPFDITWRTQSLGSQPRWLRSIGKVVSFDQEGRAARMLGVCLDVTMQQQQKNDLQQLAHFDPLTGLANRVELAARLKECLQLARQRIQLLAVVYLDLDGFKPVNDQFGHAAGDKLLVLVAKRLHNALRANDCVARLGGDEFVLLINEINSRVQCEALLERISTSLSRTYSVDGININITASMGYTLYPEDDADEDALIRHADQAMYQAKQAGRNRFKSFDSDLEKQIREQNLRSMRIREGLENNEFRIFFQPKINIREKEVIGVEALARWQHPQRGILSPDEFLPQIEGSDLEIIFGQWAIIKSLDTIAKLAAKGFYLKVSVNISARHLQHSNFAEWLTKEISARPHTPSHLLDIEITESAALYDIQHVKSVLNSLRELKISVSLDDFGTGYSSLTYLRNLPLDTLKIDRSFVRDMLSDQGDFAIVQSVSSLAKSFGYSVIAEGVETQEQCQLLEEVGCHLAQGFYFARPMDFEKLTIWLNDWKIDQKIEAI